jgi:hypothetical protein
MEEKAIAQSVVTVCELKDQDNVLLFPLGANCFQCPR